LMTKATCSLLLLLCAAACVSLPTTPQTPPPTALDVLPPTIVSAFFGLDDAMPSQVEVFCPGGSHTDGMPVTFSRRVVGAVSPSAFVVHTRSGALLHPRCATLRPADAASKRHTVLLIGDLGDGEHDPPVRVDVVDDVQLDGNASARGLTSSVIPLADGPSIVLALRYPAHAIAADPSATTDVVMVVWAGGVKPRSGSTQADHLAAYHLDGPAPFAIGDVDDRDNDVHLCFKDHVVATHVSCDAGIVVDPRGDLNPATGVEIRSALP
jgi:hypothetical protein